MRSTLVRRARTHTGTPEITLTSCLRWDEKQHQHAKHQVNFKFHLIRGRLPSVRIAVKRALHSSSALSFWCCFRYVIWQGSSSALKISWGSRAEERQAGVGPRGMAGWLRAGGGGSRETDTRDFFFFGWAACALLMRLQTHAPTPQICVQVCVYHS